MKPDHITSIYVYVLHSFCACFPVERRPRVLWLREGRLLRGWVRQGVRRHRRSGWGRNEIWMSLCCQRQEFGCSYYTIQHVLDVWAPKRTMVDIAVNWQVSWARTGLALRSWRTTSCCWPRLTSTTRTTWETTRTGRTGTANRKTRYSMKSSC